MLARGPLIRKTTEAGTDLRQSRRRDGCKFSGREQSLVCKEEGVPSNSATETMQPHQSCKNKARDLISAPDASGRLVVSRASATSARMPQGLRRYEEPPKLVVLARPSSTAQAAIWLRDLNPNLSMMCFT